MHPSRRAARTTLVYRSRSHSLALPLAHLSLSGARAKRVDKQRARGQKKKKSTVAVAVAVAMRGALPYTLAIAHTYLYTVIFKMKSRAGGRVVVDVVARPAWPLGSEETLGDDDRSHFHQQTSTRRDQSENLRVSRPRRGVPAATSIR